MNRKTLFFFSIATIILSIFFSCKEKGNKNEIASDKIIVFDSIKGPNTPTTIPKATPKSIQKHSNGLKNRLAIYLTDESSSWLALSHGLKSVGIPFLITKDYKKALEHKVVLAYPIISGKLIKPEALKAIAAHPRNGGVLLAVNVLGGGMNEVFGFNEAIASTMHFEIEFNKKDTLNSHFTDERESTIKIGDKNNLSTTRGCYSYSEPKNEPLALYEDGTASITQKSYDVGLAIAFGIDIGALLEKGYNNRTEGMSRSYANEFEPTLDVLLRLLKNIYKKHEPHSVTLGTVPYNKAVAVMITHDVDYVHSMKNAIKYAEYEKSEGIKATYFIQTKYIWDYKDIFFFDKKGVKLTNQLQQIGMEISSHTVCHSSQFAFFDLGSGKEQYPTYTPFVKTHEKTDHGTILGELRVSKFLLEKMIKNNTVVSFRPGELSNPYALPQALEATGYKYSSSVTANNSLTHLPFQLTYNRNIIGEVDIFEFPVTIEDEALPKMGDRLPQAIALTKKISNYGGSVVILIHPDILDHKLDFEKGFIAEFKNTAWFGSISDFGNWWKARDKVEIDVIEKENEIILTINAPEHIKGLPLDIPKGYKLISVIPNNIQISQIDNTFVIEEFQGGCKISLTYN